MPIRVQFGGGRGNAPAWLTSWPGRILAAALGAVILVGLVLFFTLFLAVAVVFVLGAAIRWWWAMRKVRGQGAGRADEDVVDADYQVIDVEVIEASREKD